MTTITLQTIYGIFALQLRGPVRKRNKSLFGPKNVASKSLIKHKKTWFENAMMTFCPKKLNQTGTKTSFDLLLGWAF